MQPDVTELRQFYSTGLGAVARQGIGRRLREAWPEVRGMRVLGMGFATPFLEPFRGEAERVLAVMPPGQGVIRWPEAGMAQVALADETLVPLPDESIDRVLLVHALENTEHVRQMLREIWRIMPARGRLVAVVPNRRGIWARLERTPFGYGHPFSPPQMTRLLRDNMFNPIATRPCLFMPPMKARLLLRTASAVEALGARGIGIGGVLVAEAAKQIYAISAKPERTRKRATSLAVSIDRS